MGSAVTFMAMAMAMVDNLIRVPCMCKRMKIDNRDGIFPSHSRGNGSQVQAKARQGKASQRGRAAPRFRDRWIQPTLHVPPPHVSVPRLCAFWAHQTHTHYILHLGSSSWLSPSFPPPQLPLPLPLLSLSFFSLTHLLACRASLKLARVVKPPPCCFIPVNRYPIVGTSITDLESAGIYIRLNLRISSTIPTILNQPWHRTQYCAKKLTFPVKEAETG